MNYNFSETTFPSKDGIHTVHAELYTPKNATARAVIQLAHGMIDYVGRYAELADYLTGEGFIFAGHHHLGHGKTAGSKDDFGFFAERDGVKLIIEDMHTMNSFLHDSFPTLPVIVMGHSMGSFITRLYTTAYPHSISGVIIHGTGGPNPALPFGIALASVQKLLFGARHRSKFIENLAFGSYNKRFPKEEGENAWLTRETELVAGRAEDELTSFKFTVSAYCDLFTMLKRCNSKDWFKSYPKELPTLIMSGTEDPVGDYGKGPEYVYKNLLISGLKRIDIKMYEGARHELFKETCRYEAFADIAKWVSSII